MAIKFIFKKVNIFVVCKENFSNFAIVKIRRSLRLVWSGRQVFILVTGVQIP